MSLSSKFFHAYLAKLDDFAVKGYFTQVGPDACGDGYPMYWNDADIHKALKAELGRVSWPLTEEQVDQCSDAIVIDYVEGFFQLVSKPTGSWFHDFCGNEHPVEFDSASGRYDYTLAVNALLSKFATGLRLQNGKVINSGSPTLTQPLSDRLPFGGDIHLERLVTMAVADFKSPNVQRRWAALRNLADAYERVKSLSVPGNKRQSVEALIEKVSPDKGIGVHLDGLLRELTTLSNDFTIRHHELGTEEMMHDAELVDFLFYSYFNLIRFVLVRLYGAQSQKST